MGFGGVVFKKYFGVSASQLSLWIGLLARKYVKGPEIYNPAFYSVENASQSLPILSSKYGGGWL